MSKTLSFKVPKKLKPLDESNARYKGAVGGRGSGKSYYFADKLIDRFVENPDLNWACMREVQKSIAKSSKKLLEDRIKYHGLHDYFEILQTEIRSKRGSGEIIFQGLQDHTADSIKSLEGFDGVWVEESQTITEHSLDLLIPTFRKDDSELWFSWNRRLRTDAVEKLFKTKSNSILIHINYVDNPYCSKIIIDEAEEMREKSPDKYEHIYLGGFVDTVGDKLFRYTAVKDAMERKQADVDRSGVYIFSADVARYGNDSSVMFKRRGYDVYEMQVFNNINTMEYANRIAGEIRKSDRAPDAVFIDTIGVGAGVMDRVKEQGYRAIDANVSNKAQEMELYANKRAEMYFELKEFIEKGGRIPNDEELMEELLNISYVYTETGKIRIVKKEILKEELGRSPDKADALALSFYAKIRVTHNNTFTNQSSGAWLSN